MFGFREWSYNIKIRLILLTYVIPIWLYFTRPRESLAAIYSCKLQWFRSIADKINNIRSLLTLAQNDIIFISIRTTPPPPVQDETFRGYICEYTYCYYYTQVTDGIYFFLQGRVLWQRYSYTESCKVRGPLVYPLQTAATAAMLWRHRVYRYIIYICYIK